MMEGRHGAGLADAGRSGACLDSPRNEVVNVIGSLLGERQLGSTNNLRVSFT